MINATDLNTRFHQHFTPTNDTPQLYFSPGRVNLIGEYTDYNGGFVFPAAITFGTYGVVRPRTDNLIHMFSGNFPDVGVQTLALSATDTPKSEHWTVYVQGVVATLQASGYTLQHGFDVYVFGDIPNGAGLSSSASIELLFIEILNELNSLGIDPVEKAKLAQKAEHWVGVNCGIMDQFAIAMGREGHAIKLDTNTLDYTYAQVELGDYQILIMNTNKKRELAESNYNVRRSECEQALAMLDIPHSYLCDLSVAEFDKLSHKLSDHLPLFKRAKHTISESERVTQAVEALAKGDLKTFGQLLNASHASLRDDYEVTGKELDTIVAFAQAQPGVLGARMTGAGFGGCAIALVHSDHLQAVQEQVATGYTQAIGYAPTFYTCTIGGGTGRVS